MAKKPRKPRNEPAPDVSGETLELETPADPEVHTIADLGDVGGTALYPDMEDVDEFEDDPEPASRPRRPKKSKPHASRSARADSGPLSLADLVNSPDANDAWWQEHRLVIYRKDISKDMKALMKADSGRTWIDRISGPFSQEEFDESYLRSHYGGGLFSVFLQEKPTGGNKWDALMEAEYVIAGPPKYTDEEAAAARRANPNQQHPQAPLSGERSEIGTVLDLLQRQIDRAEAPQAQALASFAETIRTGQQASTEMLMQSMRQVIEMRSQPNGGGSDKLIEMLLGMVLKQIEAKPIATEPQKSGLDQLREMLTLQKIVQEMAPKREAGPFDEVAKALMLRATETVVPEVVPASRGGDGGSWIRELVAPLLPQLPALVNGIGAFVAQQHRNSLERLSHEARLRAALIDRQRGAAPNPAGPDPMAELPSQAPPSADEQAQVQAQQMEAAKGAAQMELFIDALTSMYFGGDDPQDAAVTLMTGFPQIVQGLKTQLAPYGEWWGNAMVLGHLRTAYPGMRPVLNHPEFPAWISQVWAELSAPPDGENGGENPPPAVPRP